MTSQIIKEVAKELIEEELKGSRYTVSYRNEIKKSVNKFFSWCLKNSKEDLREITKKDLLMYHRNLENTKSQKTGELLKPTTINTRFYAIKLMFNLLYMGGYIEENPAQSVEIKMEHTVFCKRRPLSVNEINCFLENINVNTKQGLKDRAMFELIYSSGLRVCEVANLVIGDIDFYNREMIVRGKFSTDRVVPISIVAKDFLIKYLDDRIERLNEPVFISYAGRHSGQKMKSESISERFKDLLRRYNMDKKEISVHSIRHSTATHLLDNGASIRHVQELLGHKNIATTERYTHLQTEGVAKIYRKYHPREHDLFDIVDENYIKHLNYLIEKT